jgi:hypothetical protein
MEDSIMQKSVFKKWGVICIGCFCAWSTLISLSRLDAQENSEDFSCAKPYVKLIKPKSGATGEQIVIRGRRFGKEQLSGKVIFTPGLDGRIVSWKNSRISVEVPSGAVSGRVVVKNECTFSNGEFFTVNK